MLPMNVASAQYFIPHTSYKLVQVYKKCNYKRAIAPNAPLRWHLEHNSLNRSSCFVLRGKKISSEHFASFMVNSPCEVYIRWDGDVARTNYCHFRHEGGCSEEWTIAVLHLLHVEIVAHPHNSHNLRLRRHDRNHELIIPFHSVTKSVHMCESNNGHERGGELGTLHALSLADRACERREMGKGPIPRRFWEGGPSSTRRTERSVRGESCGERGV